MLQTEYFRTPPPGPRLKVSRSESTFCSPCPFVVRSDPNGIMTGASHIASGVMAETAIEMKG